MITYASLATIDKQNADLFMKALATADPELYRIKVALEESNVNPLIIPPIIRSISNLAIGSGHGKIQIMMRKTEVTQILGEESVQVHQEAIVLDQ